MWMESSYIEEFKGSEAVKSFCYKFIYWDCRIYGQMFCTKSKTSLYYSRFLFGKISPQEFYYKTSLFYWFFWVIITCLIYYSAVHNIDTCLFEQELFITYLINNLSLKFVNSINRSLKFPNKCYQSRYTLLD